ncbi:MAG: polyprenol monophosphomannose synthase [Planctomycetia bacterium]
MSTTADLHSRDDWPAGRVLVVTATFNERDNIATLIDRVLAVSPDLQLLIVDDDSPDGTACIARARAERDPRVHVLVRRGRRGLGSAILEGFELGRRRGVAVGGNMDADVSPAPDDIPRLLAALEPVGGRPADVVVGSRRIPGGRTVGWPLSRHVASRLVGWFTRWVLWVPVRDASSGFRAVRLAVFDRVSGPFAVGYAFQEDLLWRVHRAGGLLAEVPITFTDRQHGVSKADFAESRRSIGELLGLARRTWLG